MSDYVPDGRYLDGSFNGIPVIVDEEVFDECIEFDLTPDRKALTEIRMNQSTWLAMRDLYGGQEKDIEVKPLRFDGDVEGIE